MRKKQGLPVNESVRGPLKDGQFSGFYTSKDTSGAMVSDNKYRDDKWEFKGLKTLNPNDNVRDPSPF